MPPSALIRDPLSSYLASLSIAPNLVMEARQDYVDDPRFNKTFSFIPKLAHCQTTTSDTPFQITYADYGYRNESLPEEENVLLFFGSLMASRLTHIAKDKIARECKIRMLDLDRPGFGGTPSLEDGQRMTLWLEAVPALLAHLRIKWVSVACHSGGTIYALDFLLHHPELLHPERPYLAIGAPWILPSHTNVFALSLVSVLPRCLIGHTDKAAKAIQNHVGPLLGRTVGLSQGLVNKVTSSPDREGAVEPSSSAIAESSSDSFEESLWHAILDRVYAENVQGISSDATLFFQKVDGEAKWGEWGDYDTLMPLLAAALRAANRRLRVEVFYAEKDFIIGNGGDCTGARWFDRCWDVQRRGGIIEYSSTVVEGSDHDYIWRLKYGAMQKVMASVGQMRVSDA